MLSFSNKYIIVGNVIVDKKLKGYFLIDDSTRNQLLSFFSTRTLESIDRNTLQYLQDKGVLVGAGDSVCYNPFCLEDEMNGSRFFIKTTNKCNLYCKHCFVSSGLNESKCLSFDYMCKLLDETVENGIWRVDFTGGEVFIDKHFWDVLSYLELKPISYNIFSNLTLLSKNDIEKLSSLQGLCKIITSLDYFDAHKHNEFRGTHYAYEKTMSTIFELKKSGVEVIVNSMVLDDNHKDISQLMLFLKEHDVECHLDTLVNCGRAKTGLERSSHAEDMNNIAFIHEQLRHASGVNAHLPFGCGVCDTLLYIDESEMYSICPGLTARENIKYSLGKVQRDAYSMSREMNLTCKEITCKVYESCPKGCRARALGDFGDDCARDQTLCTYFNMLEDLS